MIRSFLIGALAGMRSLTPVAAISAAQSRGHLADDNGAPALLANPVVSAGLIALAGGELIGDKLPSAPDRTIAPGMAARIVTGAVACAALAPRSERHLAALLGAVGAVSVAYLSFEARKAAMRRFGQVPTGLVEDAIAVGSAMWLVNEAGGSSARGRLHGTR